MKREAISTDAFSSRESALLTDLLAQAPVGVGLVDHELRFVLANGALRPWGGEAALEPLLRRALAGEPSSGVALADGAVASAFPVRDAEGAVVGAGVVVADAGSEPAPALSARIAAERLRLALEGTETGTWEWDLATDRVTWSANLGPLFGLARDGAPADFSSYLQLIHPDDREGLTAAVRSAAREGRGYEREYRVVWPDGTVRWLHSRAHVLRDADERPAVIVGLASDVTERKRRQLGWEFLARAGLVLSESLDGATMLQQVAELAIPDLADWCVVHVCEEHGAPARVAVAHAEPDAAVAAAEPVDPNAPTGPAAVIRTGRSELYPELGAGELDAGRLGLAGDVPLRSAVVVPLSARGSTLGAVTFFYTASGREYSTTELELAEELGRRAGLALDNARLHADVDAARERAERANRRLRDLQSVIDVGLAHLDLGHLLEELLVRIREVTGTDAAAVLLLDEERRALHVRAASGIPGATEAVAVPIGQGVAGRVVAAGTPLIVEDVSLPGAPVPRLGGRSLVAVPLRNQGEIIGVLQVSAGRPRRFVSEDIELLELVADRAARAIVHARLYARAQDVAITLQRSLLPARLPTIPGLQFSARYLPALSGTEVGGDWYDVFELDDGRIAVAVGDIVGRGLRAGALMGQLRNALRAYAIESDTPSGAVRRTDRLVGRFGELSFATLALIFLSPRDGRLQMCSAGHPPALMVAPGGAGLLQPRQGPPIGSDPDERLDSKHELPAGASLVLYTDGLIEDRRSPLDAGLHALVRAARSAPDSADGLLQHIATELLAGRPREDDVALLALKRE